MKPKLRRDPYFTQPGELYRNVLSETDREHLVSNIVGHASDGVAPATRSRVAEYWRKVDPDLGARVAKGLGSCRCSHVGCAVKLDRAVIVPARRHTQRLAVDGGTRC